MPAPPWKRATGIHAVLEKWRASAETRACFRAERALPAEGGRWDGFPDLHPGLLDALRSRGIDRLYTHQREAIAHARDGRHVVIATPTASGKSLCFHLPVLDCLAKEPGATAIYLYPTKALSRDQEAGLHELIGAAGLNVGATVYDGDTPGDARRAARQNAALIMTNPDMLHAGVLPQHARWARALQNLRYVVVDELHTYRGVFGSHVAHVLQRLRRVARFHGADPTFICATATIGNPAEHTSRLLGCDPREVALIDRSTAPRGGRHVMVYDPPLVNAELGIRASYIKRAVRLAADLVNARVRTIIFGQSRNTVEIMLKYLRDRFVDEPSIREGIVAYRGGYLPDQRRRVETGLREGKVWCVVATSALELGIDIGDLDAVVCAGYPGSLAETWQRFGRAGRRGDDSLAVLVTNSAPLNQYLANHPQHLLDGAIEHARIDPDNTEILIQHLKCAAFELPFRRPETYATMPAEDTDAALDYLRENGVLHASRERYFWASDAFPANHVSLRRIGWDNFVIIDCETDETLAELDWHSTPSMLHEQAIYQHDGAQYQVEELDYDNHKAYVRKVEPDYFTTAMRNRKVTVLDRNAEKKQGAALVGWGEVSVVEKIVGYKKIKFHTHENAGYGDVRLPDIQMHTTSFWLTVPEADCERIGRVTAIEGLRGIGSALELCATLALMCDPHDIGRAMDDAAPHADLPPGSEFSATCYLFDNVPCGVGLAERIYERSAVLIAHAAGLIGSCPCALGCPSCVGVDIAAATDTPRLPNNPRGSDRKSAALLVLEELGLTSVSGNRPPAARVRTVA